MVCCQIVEQGQDYQSFLVMESGKLVICVYHCSGGGLDADNPVKPGDLEGVFRTFDDSIQLTCLDIID